MTLKPGVCILLSLRYDNQILFVASVNGFSAGFLATMKS